MRELLRKHPRFFLWATLAALALRLLFLLRFPSITADSQVYSDIARNWLHYGVYGLTQWGRVVPTFIRLPGYPAFLAAIFALFGMEHYRAVLVVQMLVDVGACLVIADLARRALSPRAARVAFLLAALCPFLANYAAAVLTETLEIFFTALALDLAMIGLDELEQGRMRAWIGCGLATAATILLRPDGGLLLAAIGAYLLVVLLRRARAGRPSLHILRAGLIVGFVALAPLVPWTLRNLRTLYRFQPLAPRYANQDEDLVSMGFNRWVKTWMVDYASVEEIYWPVPGEEIDAGRLPARAFDSAEQRQRTLDTLAAYSQTRKISPELDAQFAALAEERIRAAPLRYYLRLPALRVADMWLRPRTELLPPDTRWWEFNDDPQWSVLAVALGLINLLYLLAAALGLVRSRPAAWAGLLVTFVLLRSVFLGTLENPEPRYTLECYPVVILLAASVVRDR